MAPTTTYPSSVLLFSLLFCLTRNLTSEIKKKKTILFSFKVKINYKVRSYDLNNQRFGRFPPPFPIPPNPIDRSIPIAPDLNNSFRPNWLRRLNQGAGQNYHAEPAARCPDVEAGDEAVVGEREVGVVAMIAADRHFLQESVREGWQLKLCLGVHLYRSSSSS